VQKVAHLYGLISLIRKINESGDINKVTLNIVLKKHL